MSKVEEFFSHYTLLRYDKGERILRENETPSGVFYLKSGVVRLYLISEEGNELTVMMHENQTVFPARWAINNLPNIYNYQAMTPTEVWRAPREAFMDFLKRNPDALLTVTQQTIVDFNALVYRMQHIVFGNAHAKVASIVLTAAKRFGEKSTDDTIMVQVPLTHQQIADSAGITRETASLEMKKLKESGLISYKGRTIVIHDLKGLGEISFL